MAIKDLTEKELDTAYAEGLLGGVLENANASETIKEAFNSLVAGAAGYREKYIAVQMDYDSLLEKYNQLTALTSNYLQVIQELRQQVDGLLVETQREFHRKEE
jgi:hypothetical protein